MLAEPFSVTVPPVAGDLSNVIVRIGMVVKFARTVALPAPGVKVVDALPVLAIVPSPISSHPAKL